MDLLTKLGGGKAVSPDDLLQLPELQDILLYHIVPGLYHTGGWLRTQLCNAHTSGMARTKNILYTIS